MRVLATNDDGIFAPGLYAAAEALEAAGHDLLVVAPAHDCSGQGAAIGPLHLTGKIEFERVALAGLAAEAIAVDGPPALCVMAACLGGFGAKPDIVVSGVNAGANTGRAILHSGTVGAALTGLNFGVPGLAVSQAVGAPEQWATAVNLAVSLVRAVGELDEPVVFNLNVPNVPLDDLAGVAVAALDAGGTVQAALVETDSGVLEFRLPERNSPGGTDNHLLAQGYATLTALVGPQAGGAHQASQLSADLERLFDGRRRRPRSA